MGEVTVSRDQIRDPYKYTRNKNEKTENREEGRIKVMGKLN